MGHLLGNLYLVAPLELRQDNPRGEHAENRDAKVDANADKVVRTAFGLHTVTFVSHGQKIRRSKKRKTYAQAIV